MAKMVIKETYLLLLLVGASLFGVATAAGGENERARCVWERGWGEGPCNVSQDFFVNATPRIVFILNIERVYIYFYAIS